MSTAASLFGNSGGAVFLEDGQFVGVPARITTLQLGFGVDIITHMGFFIPVDRVYNFLEDQLFQFVYDTSMTSVQCENMRTNKIKEEEKKLIIESDGSEEEERQKIEEPDEEDDEDDE